MADEIKQEYTDSEGYVRSVPIVWVEPEDSRIIFANQFLTQFFEEEFILTFGQLTPPVVLPRQSAHERQAQIENIEFVQAKIIGRFGFTPQRMRELITILQENLARYEARQGGGGSDE